ncbi:uncharacterized protein [Clytia hemisphaerica]|uniref:uncharacterized protein n=1 Tax=Clytia hemisphaerica TaxID=252671 RepID=UPI0034D43E0A
MTKDTESVKLEFEKMKKDVYFLPLLALCIALVTAEQEEWGDIKTKTITKLDGTKITTKSGQFFEVNYSLLTSSPTLILKLTGITKNACGAQCINSVTRCLFYRMKFENIARLKGDCWLYSHLAKAEENKYSFWHFNPAYNQHAKLRSYEIKNPCQDDLLCDHGSRCVPNYENKTFSCEECEPPYFGTFCNETNGPDLTKGVEQDIREGKYQSCSRYKQNIGNEGLNMVTLHPWNDQRAVRVYCSCKSIFLPFSNITSNMLNGPT